jgi:Flp pilus assembly protein TadG
VLRRGRNFHGDQRGAALVEFTVGALVFLTATFGVLELSRLLWTHNALSDAARRAARYAVNQANPADENTEAAPVDIEAVKRVAVYGNPEGTGDPLVNGLGEAEVSVEYTNSSITGVFGYPDGSVTVSITGYEFSFVVPLLVTTISMPDYRTTLTAESAGMIPPNITPGPSTTPTPPTPTPEPTPTPAPTPTPTPAPTPTPTPAPTATPTPSPTPRSCKKGENVSTGCVCRLPLQVNRNGKCN